MQPPASAYRVFISYSHEDEDLVKALEAILRDNGLIPMRDKNFAYGIGFHDQIRRFIEYAHVFMPVVTKGSSERGWVHQEIGYAIAQNVPVLPVAIDWQPGEWLQSLHSVMLREKQLLKKPERLKAVFSQALFRELVGRFRDERFAGFACGSLQEDRAQMFADYANEVSTIQALLPEALSHDHALSSMIRQRGALSSFQIPDDPISAEIWQTRYGDQSRSEHHCRLQRAERLALGKHAERWGAKLIVNPFVDLSDYGGRAHEVKALRLGTLIQFLKSPAGKNTKVVINRNMVQKENTTIIGNWFLAMAVASTTGRGYTQTIFTRHAPSMQAKIDEFDEEFASLSKSDRAGSTPNDDVIGELEKIIGRKGSTRPIAESVL